MLKCFANYLTNFLFSALHLGQSKGFLWIPVSSTNKISDS